jgi:copper oxidase (laccase) domain-containing protein
VSGVAVPTASYRFFDGAVEVDCFGRSSGNWALKGYDRSESEANNPGIGRKIEALLKTHRIGRLYLPTPRTFNALLASSVDLTVPWYEGRIFRGAEAEGVLLDKVQDACGIASSDCPTIVARNGVTGLVVAAHAGRESLYDANRLFNGAAPRRFASVVDAIMDALLGGNVQHTSSIQAHVVCGIGQSNFSHPYDESEQGKRNEKMCAYLNDTWGQGVVSHGHISLPKLITRQFEKYGVDPYSVHWDKITTYSDTENGDYQWHSHRRTRSGERNFVLVTRRY